MKRKDFLSNSALCVVGYNFLSSAIEGFIIEKDTDAFVLNEATIEQLQNFMKTGRYSSEQITRMYLDRIAVIDKKGPSLHAVIELNPDAIAIAKAKDEERKRGKIIGPLHGIPVLIKDNIDTADKMMT